MFYDERNRSGDVYQVLRYTQRKLTNSNVQISSTEIDANNDDVEDLANFLNACNLPKDESKLKEKLQSTIQLRTLLLSQNVDTYPKQFEFYLVDPKLVRLLYCLSN